MSKQALNVIDDHIEEINEQIDNARLNKSASHTNGLISMRRKLEDIKQDIKDGDSEDLTSQEIDEAAYELNSDPAQGGSDEEQ